MVYLHSRLYGWNSLLQARRSAVGHLLLYIKDAVVFLTVIDGYLHLTFGCMLPLQNDLYAVFSLCKNWLRG